MSRAPLRFHQAFSWPARVIVGMFSVIPLWGAYDLLRAHGLSLLQWGMVPFVVMGVIALAFGVLFLGVALFGGARTLIIDRNRRLCVVEFDGTFGLHWQVMHPFFKLRAPRVVELPSNNGPSQWGVELPRRDRKPLLVETYADEERAMAEAEAIAAYMAGR